MTITAFATVGALGFAACGDVSSDELRDSLIDEGASEESAQCVVDYMEDNLSEDDFQEAAQADDPEDVSAETLDVMLEALTTCEAF